MDSADSHTPAQFTTWDLSFAAHAPGFDLAPIAIRDFDGTIRHWTRGMQRLYGYSADEANGRISHRLLRTEFPKALSEIETELLDRREWTGELRHTHRDGQRLVVSAHWSLGEDRRAGRQVISEVNQDITELKRIRMRHALLADVLESSQDAVLIKTLDGTVTDLNPAAEALYGFSAGELLGRSIFLLYPAELIAQEPDIIARIKNGEGIEHFETVRRRKDRSIIEVSLSISPVHDDDGHIVGAAHIARDITEQNAARRRVEGLQVSLAHMGRINTMGQMASALAHELRQPLAALGNYLSAARLIAAKADIDRTQLGVSIERAMQQATRTVDIVSRLQSFMSKGKTERQLADLNAVVEDSVRLGTLDAERSGVSVSLKTDEGIKPLLIDPIQIGQVVVNLVRNAVEAMRDVGVRRLEVATKATDAAAEIVVFDTGPGIAADILEKLFQPFVTSKPTGMGMGLSICRELVRAHGGALTASSREGGGTVFTVSLPLCSTVGPAKPE